MPVKPLMTWHSKTHTWFGKHRKQRLAVSCRQLKTAATKEASIVAANQWFAQRMKEIDERLDPPKSYRQGHHTVATLDGVTSVKMPGRLTHRNIPADRALCTAIARYLVSKRVLTDAGELSPGRYERIRVALTNFERWAGRKSVDDVDGRMLIDFHGWLTKQVASGKWGRWHAKQQLDDVRQFVDTYIIACYPDYTPPPNLRSRSLSIKTERHEISPFTVDEVKAIYAQAKERMKLFMLLGLNCGMTQQDISRLYRHQVDSKNGYIIRKRGKTKWHPNVPTVKYKLWAETLRLLKKYDAGRMGENDLVLVTSGGKEFVRYTYQPSGKTTRFDGIGMNFCQLLIQHFPHLKNKKTFKCLRKTGATLLGNDARYFFCAWLYLGHSAKTIAEQHYIKPSQELIDEAIIWLGKQLGFAQ